MKNILITGGLGFIGSNIAQYLEKRKKFSKFVLVDNFGGYIDPTSKNFVDYRKFRIDKINNKIIERCDTTNFKVILDLVEKYKPKIIYHTAALPLAKLENVNTDEAKKGSVDSTINLIDAINLVKKKNKKFSCRFVYISSSMIYGDFKTKVVNEDSEKNPKESYGIMKLSGEITTRGLCTMYKIPYTIIRPSAVYGPTDMNRRVSQIFIENAFKNKEIIIQGINEKLDFTYIDDLVMGCYLASIKNKGKNEVFNLTCGQGQSLFKFVKILNKHFPNLTYKIKPRDKSKPSRGTLSIKKANKLLGYKPKYTLEKGISEYIKFLKLHKIFK